MKKNALGTSLWAAALMLCFTVLFTTCKNSVGLGETVDINPPTVNAKTIYPPAGAVIKDSFILSVEAKDDTEIVSIAVSITPDTDAANSGQKLPADQGFFNLKKTADGVHWQAELNTQDAKKNYPIKDGSYQAEFLAKDRTGKEVRAVTTFTIDNTPPLLILNRPSTTTANASPDVFGADFLLVGQVYDETSVSTLKIAAEGNGQKREKILSNIPQNIRITVDSFGSKADDPFYDPLYHDTEAKGQKNYEYTIAVTDSAKVYKTPGDLDASEKNIGNTTNSYYLFDDLYKPVLSIYKIQEVYAMLRGTYKTSVGRAAVETDAKAAEKVNAVLAAHRLGGENTKKGTFALNPSRNPRFAVAGEEPVARIDIESGAKRFSNLYSGNTLQVKLSRNYDEVPLDSADSYRFFLMKWDDFLAVPGVKVGATGLVYPTEWINGDSIYADEKTQTLKSDVKLIKIPNSAVAKEGNDFTLKIEQSLGLQYGSRYVLLVRGKDQNDNKLVPDLKKISGSAYGFVLVKTGKAPEVYVTQINNTVGTGADGTITERVYLKKGDSLKFKMKLKSAAAEVAYTLKGAVGIALSKKELYPVGEHEVIIDKEKFNQDADDTYKLTVQAKADEGTSLEQTYTIVYDAKGPDIRIAFPAKGALLNGDEGAGLVIQGSAFDTGSGLVDADPVTVTLTKEGGTAPAVQFAENGENWKLQPITLHDGKYTLTVTAKDKLGQQTSKEITFTYDKAAPVISDLKVKIGSTVEKAVKGDEPVYTNTRSISISGNVVESYGIKTFKIGEINVGTNPGHFDQPITIADTEANQNVKITLMDKAGRDGSRTINVVLDKTAPVFADMEIAGHALSGTNDAVITNSSTVAISGKIIETGSGVAAVEYQLEGDTEWKKLAVKDDNGDYKFEGFTTIEIGSTKKLLLRVRDNTGHETPWQCSVAVHSTVPSLTLKVEDTPSSGINGNGIYYRKSPAQITMHGYLTTATGHEDIRTEVKKADGALVPLVDFFVDAAGVESLKVKASNTLPSPFTTKALADGEYYITISSSGQVKTITLIIDTKGPSIRPVSPFEGGRITGGTALDAAFSDISGIMDAKAYYQKVGGMEHSLPLTAPDYKAPLPTPLEEGKYEVWFSAKDNLGNASTTSKMTVWNDLQAPVVTLKVKRAGSSAFTQVSEIAVKDNFEVQITGKDANGIKAIKLEASKQVSGNTAWQSIYNETVTTAVQEYEKTCPINISASPLNDHGTYTLRAEVEDNAGRKSYANFEVIRDTGAPILLPDALPTGWQKGRTLQVKGKAIETISGLEKVEAIVNGTAKVLSSETNWSGYIELKDGENKIKFRATDKAGNQRESEEYTVKVDSERPTIGLTTETTVYVNKAANGTFTANITVADNPPSGSPSGTVVSGLKQIQYSKDASFSSFQSHTVTANGAAAIALSGLTATTAYYFRAVDNAENESGIVQLSLFVDAQEPEVSFGEYTPKVEKGGQAYTNKKVHVRGTARDNDVVKKVTVTVAGTKVDNTPVANVQVAEFTDASTSGWSFDLNTEDYKDNDSVTLTAKAEDNSGNTKTAQLVLKVNQDTDSPRVRIEAVDTAASDNETHPTVLVQKRQLKGTVLDDDGIVKTIEIAQDEAFTIGKKEFTATSTPISAPNWEYDGLPSDGNVKLYFRITDVDNTVFISSTTSTPNSRRPFLYTVNEQNQESFVEVRGPLALRTDSTRPDIAAQHIKVLPRGGSTLETLSGMQYCKSSGTLTLEVPVYDSSGIQSVTATVEGKSPVSAKKDTRKTADMTLAGKTYAFWAFNMEGGNAIPFDSLVSGTYVIKLEAKDTNGLTSSVNIIVTVDDVKPLVQLSSYTAQDLDTPVTDTEIVKKQLGGKVLLIGSLSDGADGSGTDPSTVQLAIGRDEKLKLINGDTKTDAGGVTAETGSATWQLVCENICQVGELYSDYANKDSSGHFIKYNENNEKLSYNSSSTSDYAKSKIYEVPLVVTVSDRAGNTKKQTYLLLVDSDGAAPDVKVTAPQHIVTTDSDPDKAYNGYSVPTMGNSTIVFSGTAQPKIAGTGKVTTIQVRFSEQADFKKSFFSAPPENDTAVEWKDGVTVVKDTSKNLDTWTFDINGSKFLKNGTETATKRKLFYQVRGLYEDGSGIKSTGEWSETRKLIIDQSAPFFSAIYITQAANKYEVNKSVKTGDIVYIKVLCETDISSIELSSTTKSLETGGKPAALNKKYDKSGLMHEAPDSSPSGSELSNKWTRWNIPEDTVNKKPAQKGYTIPITLDVSQLNDPNETLVLNVKVNTTKDDQPIPNTQVLVFRYDKYKPQVVFGTVVGKFGKGIFGSNAVIVPKDGLPATADNLYIFVRDTDENSKAAHKIKVTGINVSGNTATLSYAALSSDLKQKLSGECLYVLFKKDAVLFNSNGAYKVQGIAHDRGTGVDKGKVVARVFKVGITPSASSSAGNYAEVTMTRDDATNKISGESGTFVTFKGDLNVATLGDGSSELWITAYDEAHNESPIEKEPVYLRNNPVAVVKMYFQTDLDKNGSYDKSEESYAVAGNPKVEVTDSKNDFKNLYDKGFVYRQMGVDTTGSFTFKNRTTSALKVEFVGGAGVGQTANSAYSYKLYKEQADSNHLIADASKTVTQGSVKNLATANTGFASFDIPLKGKFGTGNKSLNEGVTDLILRISDSVTTDPDRYAEVRMKVAAKLTDGRLPQAVILPFYWNNQNDNSLKDHSTDKGHIEIASTPNPSLSGSVVLRGFAYHPSFVQGIKLSGAGIDAHIAYKTTDSDGKWTGDSSATPGFTATTKYLSRKGHWVQWEYVWDTPAPALSQTIKVQVESVAETAAFVAKPSAAAATSITVKAGAAEHIAAAAGHQISFIDANGSAVGSSKPITAVTQAGGDKTISWAGALNLSNATIAQIYLLSPDDAIKPPTFEALGVSNVTVVSGSLPASTAVTAGQFIRLTDAVPGSTPPAQMDGEQSYLVSATVDSSGGQISWKPDTSSVPAASVSRAYLYPIGYQDDKSSTPAVDESLIPAYNNPKLTVDVVPYITTVETGLTSADSGFKGSFSRASTGEYPVRIGEKIKISGFNLSGATYKLNGVSLTGTTDYEIKSAHSTGALVATVGSVESINNKVDITKPYNIEANGMNNNILTVNRKLFVWKMEPIINNNAMESPQFVMDKNSNFYMSLGSLGGASPMKFFMLKNQRLNGIADMNNDTYAFETTHSKFHNTVVGYDEAGNIYGGSTNTDKGGGDTTSFNFVAKEKPGVTNNYASGAGKRRLEGSLNSARSGGEIYDVNRVQIPKVAIVGKGSNSDQARIALAYYDRNNDNPPIKFRYGTVGTDSHTSMAKGLGFDLSASDDYSANGYEIIADANTVSNTYKSGLYVGVGLVKLTDSKDRAVVAWYDSTNSALIYSYKDFDSSYTAPTGSNKKTADWQGHAVRVDGAAPLFIDLVVDDEGGVHIGYYSSGEGGVKYAYLAPAKVKGSAKPNTSDFKIVKVDTYMNPGTYLKIGVRKENNKQVPYISYYHNGFFGSKNAARIAWLKDGIGSNGTVVSGVENNKFTGNWVVMTVPASSGIQQYTICNGVPTEDGTNGYKGKVIAAYFTNKNYEMAILTK